MHALPGPLSIPAGFRPAAHNTDIDLEQREDGIEFSTGVFLPRQSD